MGSYNFSEILQGVGNLKVSKSEKSRYFERTLSESKIGQVVSMCCILC